MGPVGEGEPEWTGCVVQTKEAMLHVHTTLAEWFPVP